MSDRAPDGAHSDLTAWQGEKALRVPPLHPPSGQEAIAPPCTPDLGSSPQVPASELPRPDTLVHPSAGCIPPAQGVAGARPIDPEVAAAPPVQAALAARSSRRGSEVRKKQERVTIRLSPAERAELEAGAARSGVSVGAYIRARVLDAPTTRARRRPSVEVEALTRLQGEMNRVGSNIHQLLRRINFGDTPAGDEVRGAFAGYRDVIGAILAVLGRGPR